MSSESPIFGVRVAPTDSPLEQQTSLNRRGEPAEAKVSTEGRLYSEGDGNEPDRAVGRAVVLEEGGSTLNVVEMERNEGLRSAYEVVGGLIGGEPDNSEGEGIISQRDRLKKELEVLRKQLMLKIRENQQLEERVRQGEKSSVDKENALMAENEQCMAECQELRDQVENLQDTCGTLTCQLQAMQGGTMKDCGADADHEMNRMREYVQFLEDAVCERDARIVELEQQDLKGPVIIKGELKMLRKDHQSALDYIKEQDLEIARLKKNLKRSREAACEVEADSDDISSNPPPEVLQEVHDNISNENEQSEIPQEHEAVPSEAPGELGNGGRSGEYPLEEGEDNSNCGQDFYTPYYAGKLGKVDGMRVERGKNIKVNHRLDYFHNPENAPFLLPENKGAAWYIVPTEDGGEELKVVKLRKPTVQDKSNQEAGSKRPHSACGGSDAPSRPNKKPVWRVGTAGTSNMDKFNADGKHGNQAQPIPTLHWKTIRKAAPKPPTVPLAKVMWSEFRAQAREAGFGAYMKQKEDAIEMMKLEEEEARERRQRIEDQEARKARQFKARPMPHFPQHPPE